MVEYPLCSVTFEIMEIGLKCIPMQIRNTIKQLILSFLRVTIRNVI